MTDLIDDYEIDSVIQPSRHRFDSDTRSEQQAPGNNTNQNTNGDSDSDILGVDNEIVVKTRKPIVKLDETRLLGPGGLDVLQVAAKSRVRFKGKGHEIKDLGRLLEFYQLWAHGLYPKARFDDFLYLARSKGSQPMARIWRKQKIMNEKTGNAGRQTGEDTASPLPSNIGDHTDEQQSEQTVPNVAVSEEIPEDWEEEYQTRFEHDPSLFVSDNDENIVPSSEKVSKSHKSRPSNSLFFDSEDEDLYSARPDAQEPVQAETTGEETNNTNGIGSNSESFSFDQFEEDAMGAAQDLGF